MVVETGHAFSGDILADEVARALRLGGELVQCGFLIEPARRLPAVAATLERAGLVVGPLRDFAGSVLDDCRTDAPRRTRLFRFLPRALRAELMDLAAAPGSQKFAAIESSRRGDYLLPAVKPA